MEWTPRFDPTRRGYSFISSQNDVSQERLQAILFSASHRALLMSVN